MLQALALGIRPEVGKEVVSVSAFRVSFCILFSGGDLCPKAALKSLGPCVGVTKSYSNLAHAMHACDLHSHEFSPVTPARNIYGVRCVPSCHPPASGKHLSYVPLRVKRE